jgi:hypothetical protein
MRELTRTEIETISGARRSAPRPIIPVELSNALAVLRDFLRGRGMGLPPTRA